MKHEIQLKIGSIEIGRRGTRTIKVNLNIPKEERNSENGKLVRDALKKYDSTQYVIVDGKDFWIDGKVRFLKSKNHQMMAIITL